MTTTTAPFYELQLLSADAETTGIDPFTDRVVTFSMVVDYPEAGKPPAIKQWLIKPDIEIPEGASAIHGITNEYAQENGMEPAVALAEIAEALTKWDVRELPIIFYNSQFDTTLLLEEFKRYGIAYEGKFTNVIDPYVLDKLYDKYRKGKRQLEITAAHYGVKEFDAHDATGDSIAAAGIARAIGKKYNIALSPSELFAVQQKAKYDQSVQLQKYFRTSGKPEAFVPTGWPFRTVESDAADHLR